MRARESTWGEAVGAGWEALETRFIKLVMKPKPDRREAVAFAPAAIIYVWRRYGFQWYPPSPWKALQGVCRPKLIFGPRSCGL